MVHSKKGLSTMSWMTERKKFHLVMSQEPSQQEQHLSKGCVNDIFSTSNHHRGVRGTEQKSGSGSGDLVGAAGSV